MSEHETYREYLHKGVRTEQYEQFILGKMKIRATVGVSRETQALIDRGTVESMEVLNDIANELLYTFHADVWGKDLNSVSEQDQVRVPATWFSHLLETTWVGKQLQRVGLRPKFHTHTLCVRLTNTITFPEWVPTLPPEFGKAVIRTNKHSKTHSRWAGH